MTLHECMCVQLLSRVQLFMTPMTVAQQASLSMGFPRQEQWTGLPSPPLGDLPNPGIKPTSLTSPVLAGGFFITSATWEATKQLQLTTLLQIQMKQSEGLRRE